MKIILFVLVEAVVGTPLAQEDIPDANESQPVVEDYPPIVNLINIYVVGSDNQQEDSYGNAPTAGQSIDLGNGGFQRVRTRQMTPNTYDQQPYRPGYRRQMGDMGMFSGWLF